MFCLWSFYIHAISTNDCIISSSVMLVLNAKGAKPQIVFLSHSLESLLFFLTIWLLFSLHCICNFSDSFLIFFRIFYVILYCYFSEFSFTISYVIFLVFSDFSFFQFSHFSMLFSGHLWPILCKERHNSFISSFLFLIFSLKAKNFLLHLREITYTSQI